MRHNRPCLCFGKGTCPSIRNNRMETVGGHFLSVLNAGSTSSHDWLTSPHPIYRTMPRSLLTGSPPFERALPSRDPRCHLVVVQERLVDLLSAWNMSLSREVRGTSC